MGKPFTTDFKTAFFSVFFKVDYEIDRAMKNHIIPGQMNASLRRIVISLSGQWPNEFFKSSSGR
ncbi:hypothetical protein Cabys_2369 [Caldithrix abyssi DSM 13497]|uniref:Uncharacterized protein n=1 Tax=Caldithrix abyssi DSM 13497 TaxID=880073 RepID=A0A1J1C998_CALAY|nr:hypothetical protein Cabys_2369 [Caldithrix abyssi DSM 13497]